MNRPINSKEKNWYEHLTKFNFCFLNKNTLTRNRKKLPQH